MYSTTYSDPISRSQEEVILARIRKEATLERILDETAIDFMFCQTDRTLFGIASRIIIFLGSLGFLYAWATLGYPWLIAFIALVACVEAYRANRRIDALIELQNMQKRSEQAAPSNP